MIKRVVKLPKTHSFFLLGPRQTGKSTLINTLYKDSTWAVDLLETETFLRYAKEPSLFRKEAETQIKKKHVRRILIDEVQRLPGLLNEVQLLMGARPAVQFILTGSSARKLRRGGANMLGGRAYYRELFPFVHAEIPEDFDLDRVLQYGTLPPVHGQDREEAREFLSSYVDVYLREEIQQEGVVRNLGGFARFLEMAAAQSGETVNVSNTARECGLPVRTVQSYYEILEDTLIGLRLEPWRKSLRKRLMGHPKFYFFDMGVTNAVNRRLVGGIDPVSKGRLFEQFIFLETYRLFRYQQSETGLFYWKTNGGAEVDLVIEKHGKLRAAFEIKSSAAIGGSDLSGLKALRQDEPKIPAFVVCNAAQPYEKDGIGILPWREFLSEINRFIQ